MNIRNFFNLAEYLQKVVQIKISNTTKRLIHKNIRIQHHWYLLLFLLLRVNNIHQIYLFSLVFASIYLNNFKFYFTETSFIQLFIFPTVFLCVWASCTAFIMGFYSLSIPNSLSLSLNTYSSNFLRKNPWKVNFMPENFVFSIVFNCWFTCLYNSTSKTFLSEFV